MKLLLEKLNGVTDRKARFRTAVAMIIGSTEKIFEGIVDGKIIEEAKGIDGFGYDPIFMPEGEQLTFAEMSAEQKNSLSHRRRALDSFMEFFDK